MGIAESLRRLIAAFIDILQTRAELITIEVEEEVVRYFSYLMFSLAALFFLGVACLLIVLLVVILYWDTYRITALSLLIALFVGAGLYFGWWVRRHYRHKPKLLGSSLTELSKDIAALKPPLR